MKRRLKFHRANLRITDADDVVLNEVMIALPTRVVADALRFALRVARWYLRETAKGNTVCFRRPNGEIVEGYFDL
jgi:hypothetical protein